MIPMIDAHSDTLSLIPSPEAFADGTTQVTLKKLRQGGVCLQCLAVFNSTVHHPEPASYSLELISRFTELCRQYDQLLPVRTAADLKRAIAGEKIGVLLTVEGGELLLQSTSMLRILSTLGVKMMSLSWNNDNPLAGGAEGENKGLTPLGADALRQMEQLGILADVSHAGERTFWDIARHSTRPIVASHSNAYAVCKHKRSLKDEQIKEIARRSGCIGICFYQKFLSEAPHPSLKDVLAHIEHIAALVGPGFVGIGSDFDGADSLLPPELKDSAHLQAIPEALARLNYTQDQINAICWKNWADTLLRVL